MIENPKKVMVMSMTPSNRILITLFAASTVVDTNNFRACLDAVATEAMPMTEAAFASFVARHGGRPAYPTLKDYPRPE